MKTSDLTGAALDWAVAKCEGLEVYFDDGVVCLKGQPFDDNGHYWLPSTDWTQGGPIIEREELTLSHSPYDHVFYGRTRPWCAEKKGRMEYGPTPLIAAMRCYVASKLGDEIELPKELK
jgi:hypothetical protein